MAQTGIWSDNLVVHAMAQVLKREIHIYTSTQQAIESGNTLRIIKYEGDDGLPPIYLGHISEVHYVSVGDIGEVHVIAMVEGPIPVSATMYVSRIIYY